ncbi:MAG: gamma-glutamyltransferase [Myxococcales bacterium]|nr:gamma-glutamyltransferase [Myxococcales bacterium]
MPSLPVWRHLALSLSSLALAASLGCRGPGGRGSDAPADTAGVGAQTAEISSPSAKRSLPARDPNDAATAVGIHGAVASAEANASEIGVEILKKGGNAVDAAIAVAFALAVTHPSAGNLGGGGFMVVRMADGRVAAIDYRERAPKAASRDMYLDAKGETTRGSLDGAKAAGIPGTVAGLALAHQRYGSLPWAELVAPAIRLANEGHRLDAFHADDLKGAVEKMEKLGFASTADLYRGQGGVIFVDGDLWKQPELAASLEIVAGDPRAFYVGPFADTMVAGVRGLGGIWSADDLAEYQAIPREPVIFEYRGHQVITMPPPSAGGVVMRQILAASEILDIKRYPWHSVDEVHLYVEAARRAYVDRNYLLGDPDFVKVPLARLLDHEYMRARLADVDLAHATPSSKVEAGLPAESMETTHFSVVDDAGNAVSNTYTLNTSFGAKVVIPGTGILLNNEMDDFAVKPGTANAYGLVQGERNRIEPGKRMLSSMTPTILVKDGALRAVVGTPGGSTITTTVTQIVRALIDYEQPLDVAVKAPRLHHQWLPDRIMAEPEAGEALLEGLRARGHEVVVLGSAGWLWRSIGHANCVEVDPATGGYRAVADIARDGGKAVAY